MEGEPRVGAWIKRMKQNRFLVLTSLEDFWDKSNENSIYIEDGCVRKLSQYPFDEYEIIQYKHLQNILEIKKEHDYMSFLIDSVLVKVADALNELHQIKLQYSSWGILLYYWLNYYVETMHIKYCLLERACEAWKLNTYIIDEKDYIHPKNGGDFLKLLVSDDLYNLQLYSELVPFFNIRYEKKACDAKDKEDVIFKTVKERFRKSYTALYNLKARNAEHIVINPETFKFSFMDRYKIKRISKGKTKFIKVTDNYPLNQCYYNRDLRLKFQKMIDNGTGVKFEKIILQLIPYDIPIFYIEGFKKIYEEEIKNCAYNTKRIITAEAWHCSDMAKMKVALLKARNAKLETIKIGGDGDIYYGLSETSADLKYSDIVYTSGWMKGNMTRILTNPRWSGLKEKKVDKEYDILYGTTATFSYIPMCENPCSFGSGRYVYEVIEFLKKLKMIDNLRVKVRPCKVIASKCPWDIEKKIEEVGFKCDDWTMEFGEVVAKSRLLIVDILSTIWIEALLMDIPFIVVSPRNFDLYSKEGEFLVKRMKTSEMFFENHDDAVRFIHRNINNIEEWWKKESVESAKQYIRKQYGYCASNIKEEWIKNFTGNGENESL